MDSSAAQQVVCPSCGNYVAQLDERNGWCPSCVAKQDGKISRICRGCGKEFYVKSYNRSQWKCGACKYKANPGKRAPTVCTCCGKRILARVHAKRHAVNTRFCSRPDCVQMKASYMSYRQKGLSISDAMDKARNRKRKNP